MMIGVTGGGDWNNDFIQDVKQKSTMRQQVTMSVREARRKKNSVCKDMRVMFYIILRFKGKIPF